MTVRILTLPKFVAEYCVMSVELMMDGVGTAASITVESYWVRQVSISYHDHDDDQQQQWSETHGSPAQWLCLVQYRLVARFSWMGESISSLYHPPGSVPIMIPPTTQCTSHDTSHQAVYQLWYHPPRSVPIMIPTTRQCTSHDTTHQAMYQLWYHPPGSVPIMILIFSSPFIQLSM